MDDDTTRDEAIPTSDETVRDGGPEKASGDVRPDAAGQQTGPPGGADRDESAVREGLDRLDQAGGGH